MAFSLTIIHLFHYMRQLTLYPLRQYTLTGHGIMRTLPPPNSSFCLDKVQRYDFNATNVPSSEVWPPNNLITDIFFPYFGPISKVVVLLGLIGNILNIILLTRPSLRGITFTYLFWLAVSDFGYLILNSQMFVLYDMFPSLLHSCGYMFFFCRLTSMGMNALYTNSVWLVTILAIGRHRAICDPLKRPKPQTYRRTYLKICASFLLALLLYAPIVFQTDVILQVTNLWAASKAYAMGWTKDNLIIAEDAVPMERFTLHICGVTTLDKAATFQAYVVVREILGKLLPVAIVTVLNLKMMIALWKNRSVRKNMTCSSGVDREKEDRRLTWLLIAIVLMQIICTTPQLVSWCLASESFKIGGRYWVFDAVAELLLSVNAAGNFYLYCLCSAAVRKELAAIIKAAVNLPLKFLQRK